MRGKLRVSEDIERAAWSDLFAAAPKGVKSAFGLEARTLGRTLVLCCPGVDSLLLNRALGLGTRGPVTPRELDEVLSTFEKAGVRRYLVHADPQAAPVQLTDWLEARGLVRHPRSWIKLVRPAATPVASAPSKLTVVEAQRDRRDELGQVAALGSGLPLGLAPLFGATIGRPGWRTFAALEGSTPVATAALFVGDGTVHFTGSATLPSHRGRGAQAALLARRIRAANALACGAVHAETGEAVPGVPNHSERNMRRAGFVPNYVRPNYWPGEAITAAA